LRGKRGAGGRQQVHPDRGAVTFLAVELDVTGRLLDEAVDHAQAEAGALARSLRREERVEYLVENTSRNAGAGITHRNHGVAAGPDVLIHAGVVFVENDGAGLDDELAAIGHGVAGVEREI